MNEKQYYSDHGPYHVLSLREYMHGAGLDHTGNAGLNTTQAIHVSDCLLSLFPQRVEARAYCLLGKDLNRQC